MSEAALREDERFAVGDYVRYDHEAMKSSGEHPHADQSINANSPMLVSEYDKVTKLVTCTRQGQVVGVFPEGYLIKVGEDGLPLPPPVEPPPDTMAGGLGIKTKPMPGPAPIKR
jgi:hypothetical protein